MTIGLEDVGILVDLNVFLCLLLRTLFIVLTNILISKELLFCILN